MGRDFAQRRILYGLFNPSTPETRNPSPSWAFKLKVREADEGESRARKPQDERIKKMAQAKASSLVNEHATKTHSSSQHPNAHFAGSDFIA
jgi:hypothetical protein